MFQVFLKIPPTREQPNWNIISGLGGFGGAWLVRKKATPLCAAGCPKYPVNTQHVQFCFASGMNTGSARFTQNY
jgi:hypothetical protein